MAEEQERSCALYRHFDSDGALLYVGISVHPTLRTYQHMHVSDWSDEIANITVERFDARSKALAAETEAIRVENPKYNIQKRLRRTEKWRDKLARITETAAEKSRVDIVRGVVLRPLYTVDAAADTAGVTKAVLKREISAGNLAYVMLPAPKADRLDMYISGWQLIDWVESRELQSIDLTVKELPLKQDLVRQFLSEETKLDPNNRSEQADTFIRWQIWCVGKGVSFGSKKAFTMALADQGINVQRSNGDRFYGGISLNQKGSLGENT